MGALCRQLPTIYRLIAVHSETSRGRDHSQLLKDEWVGRCNRPCLVSVGVGWVSIHRIKDVYGISVCAMLNRNPP